MVRLLWVKGLISLNPSQVSARSLKDAKAGSVHIQMVQNILKPLQVILRSLHTKLPTLSCQIPPSTTSPSHYTSPSPVNPGHLRQTPKALHTML